MSENPPHSEEEGFVAVPPQSRASKLVRPRLSRSQPIDELAAEPNGEQPPRELRSSPSPTGTPKANSNMKLSRRGSLSLNGTLNATLCSGGGTTPDHLSVHPQGRTGKTLSVSVRRSGRSSPVQPEHATGLFGTIQGGGSKEGSYIDFRPDMSATLSEISGVAGTSAVLPLPGTVPERSITAAAPTGIPPSSPPRTESTNASKASEHQSQEAGAPSEKIQEPVASRSTTHARRKLAAGQSSQRPSTRRSTSTALRGKNGSARGSVQKSVSSSSPHNNRRSALPPSSSSPGTSKLASRKKQRTPKRANGTTQNSPKGMRSPNAHREPQSQVRAIRGSTKTKSRGHSPIRPDRRTESVPARVKSAATAGGAQAASPDTPSVVRPKTSAKHTSTRASAVSRGSMKKRKGKSPDLKRASMQRPRQRRSDATSAHLAESIQFEEGGSLDLGDMALLAANRGDAGTSSHDGQPPRVPQLNLALVPGVQHDFVPNPAYAPKPDEEEEGVDSPGSGMLDEPDPMDDTDVYNSSSPPPNVKGVVGEPSAPPTPSISPTSTAATPLEGAKEANKAVQKDPLPAPLPPSNGAPQEQKQNCANEVNAAHQEISDGESPVFAIQSGQDSSFVPAGAAAAPASPDDAVVEAPKKSTNAPFANTTPEAAQKKNASPKGCCALM